MGAPMTGALATTEFSKGTFGELSLAESIAVLKNKVSAVQRGDLRNAEALLTTQAVPLNVIFTELARRAARNMGTYLDVTDTYLRLALKAQSQCRTTLETLATIKNPPNVAFVRQANIAHHQQVNNAPTAPRARENNFQQTQLLEATDGERLDVGATATASGADPALASVGAIDRATHGGR